jgi:hypothetical protein
MKNKLSISPNLRFQSLFLDGGVDFTRIAIETDGITRLDRDCGFRPNEFLSFAKLDKQQGGKRGRTNAITNAKRAIDAQIDRILSLLGYDFKSLPKYIPAFVNEFCDVSSTAPIKLKMINALGLAPLGLVTKIRRIRNKTEHEYALPNSTDVNAAIEVAELFIAATDRHLLELWDIGITDSKHYSKKGICGIIFWFSEDKHYFETDAFDPKKGQNLGFKLRPEHIGYAFVLRLCFTLSRNEYLTETIKHILKYVGHPVSLAKVRIVLNEMHAA